METKHTEGVWYRQADTVASRADVEGDVICFAPIGFEDSMQYWEANVKLITAAPELLEALKSFLEHVEFVGLDGYYREANDIVMLKAKKAIEKAIL